MDEIISEFLVESYEGLDQLDQDLVTLEESPDDISVLKAVFRTFHTIKGTCGFLGFAHLEGVSHAAENLLSLLRDGLLDMTPEIADALLATVDSIRAILANIDQTEEEGKPDVAPLISTLKRLAVSTESDAAVEAGGAHTQSADDPDSPETPEDPTRIGDLLVSAGAADRTDVEIAAAEQELGDDRALGEILVDAGQANSADVEDAAASQRKSAAGSTIRVDVALLDRLMNLVGELVLSRNQIIQLADEQTTHAFVAPAQRLNLITSELQEGVMKTRMQSIDHVWSKLPRLVRDLSSQLHKKVRIEMVGKDTELDRTINEAIKDPLTHIVRNTVDHGIETPEERVAAGKNPEGVLLLRANHEGGQVNIEISDDGKGISADAIRETAVDRGFITADAAARMSDNEVVQLIFQPGFSTANNVSNVSGRGVGMDVVKTNVEKIGGSVDIKTEEGVGTTFKIKIPLTLAIIPALTVSCDGNRYSIPQLNLLELVRLDANNDKARIEDIHGTPVYRLRGRLLPIVDLRKHIGAPSFETDITNIVVLQADDQQFGLVVDTIEDTEEIVVKPLGRQVKEIKLFSGATIMGDGRIALILDVLGLASEASLLKLGADHEAYADESTTGTGGHVLGDRTILLLGLGDDRQVAIPLSDVDRLEEFPANAIEESENRPVVQYRQKVIPLLDLASEIGVGSSAFGDSDTISVVVCSFNGHTVGIAVRNILDIISHAETFESINDDSETVSVHGLVTDIVDVESLARSLLPIPSEKTAEDEPVLQPERV